MILIIVYNARVTVAGVDLVSEWWRQEHERQLQEHERRLQQLLPNTVLGKSYTEHQEAKIKHILDHYGVQYGNEETKGGLLYLLYNHSQNLHLLEANTLQTWLDGDNGPADLVETMRGLYIDFERQR